jgi:hypothetical protein
MIYAYPKKQYRCLSTDTKPLVRITPGAELHETDTYKWFDWVNTSWAERVSSEGGASWGSITGTISAQTDLAGALGNKSDTSHTHSYEPANANIQTHVTSAHAPSNAQANADVTKAEIEAKLTGTISSHTHASSGGLGYTLSVQALTSSPGDGATVYFGQQPRAPGAVNLSRVYVRKAGTIMMANILCQSGTAGTAESWSLYIRKNNTTDYLIATLTLSAAERVFANSSLSIAMAAGDYFEIKSVQPTWTTNPLTTIYGGYVYIE